MLTEIQEMLKNYAHEVSNLYKTGVTTEHSFRGSLQTLLNSLLPQYSAVNEPQRSACGAPDYALVGKKDRQPHAYVEAKDLFDNDLRGVNAKGHKEQFDRYKQALSRVAFTDYLDFRFVVDGEETAAVSLLKPNAKGGFDIADGEQFVSILTQWADCSIQPISSARRLAEVMAYKARLLRESIEKALKTDEASDIHGQYEAFKNILLSDLTPAGFADLYAQTIVYGMFAARLNDPTPEDFSRQEAATLIPFSNPFLRKIFQQIAVFDLDSRIAWIVDDLVEAFAATDVGKIMGRYQQNSLHQDPLIHFYEDFLAAYDPKLRKACGVYYTPQPVVSFIVRAIDEVLMHDFGLADGLADDSKFTRKVKEQQGTKMVSETLHRVQILDPATGTGTFLAEAVRQIYKRFEGNEGLWPGYFEESLRPRLHGFELLMAPYTITHLKLDMMIGGAVFNRTKEERFLTAQDTRAVENRTSNPFYDKNQPKENYRTHLPHWHQDGKLQFVTFRLADSLPQEKLQQFKADKELFEKNNQKPWDKETEANYYKQFGSKIDEWLDAGYGSCVLQFPYVRQVVNDAILHFNGERYILHSYVIMPNHVHVMFEPLGDNKTSDILHSWKRFTANEINKLIGSSGAFWQKESFDRIIRNEEHYKRVCQYIKDNPKNLHESKYTLGGAVFNRTKNCDVENVASNCAVGNRTSRLRVYLTNSLEECHPDTGTLFAQWLSNESSEANAIKRDCPVMVMMGNPPYSGESQNKGEWIMNLMEDYKKEPGGKVKLNERNPKWINDDYVKFIRMAQHYIERNEQGVIGFINPHGFLDNPTFRGMRWNLLHTFDKIYTINLHGNSKKKETCPDGSSDENVFDIMQGVSINIFVKTGKKGKNELGKVFYADLYGKREVKNEYLDTHSLYGENAVDFQELHPKEPMLFFVPKDTAMEEEYNKFISLANLFKENNVGVLTSNDEVLTAFSSEDLFINLRENKIDADEHKIIDFSYKPFDTRKLYYDTNLLERPRAKFMFHLLNKENIALVASRQCVKDWEYVSVSDKVANFNLIGPAGRLGAGYLFPLYLYDSLGERHLNMREDILMKVLGGAVFNRTKDSDVGNVASNCAVGNRTSEDVASQFLAYIYAVLHSPSYRERYKEFLKIDFPRIPLPTDEAEYQRLVALGQQLIDLHLMRDVSTVAKKKSGLHSLSNNDTNSCAVENRTPKYPVPGTNMVETPHFADGRVYINDQQYFDGITETAWTFFIGGYQPAQKWLKDRRGRTLALNDIRHYQRIIATLDRTAEIMGEIG